jgi:hypothetical protein
MDREIKTGVGNPLDPYNDELLSVEDEKRLDDKGRLVVHGKPWSSASTGLFLWSALWVGDEITQLVPGGKGQSDIDLSGLYKRKWTLSIGLSQGRPRFNLPCVGASIEVPSDIGDDSLKQKYLGEWLVATVLESLENRDLPVSKDIMDELALKVSFSADRAISKVM